MDIIEAFWVALGLLTLVGLCSWYVAVVEFGKAKAIWLKRFESQYFGACDCCHEDSEELDKFEWIASMGPGDSYETEQEAFLCPTCVPDVNEFVAHINEELRF